MLKKFISIIRNVWKKKRNLWSIFAEEKSDGIINNLYNININIDVSIPVALACTAIFTASLGLKSCYNEHRDTKEIQNTSKLAIWGGLMMIALGIFIKLFSSNPEWN